MSWIPRVLGDLIKDYVTSVSQAAGEYRLIVPGLTTQIGEELHDILRERGINSYLVIGKSRSPDEEKQWLLPLSLTSVRIGSFIAISDPGTLSDVQDSIRGSGGAIRSAALSEEWPWIDNGSDTFQFVGSFLPKLVSLWTSDEDLQVWLRSLIATPLLESTRRGRNRVDLLLGRILGNFDSSLPPELLKVRERFLFHCGIPKPDDANESPAKIIRSTQSLVHRILDRVKEEPNLREQVLKNVDASSPDADVIITAVHSFFDGLATPSSLEGDALSLRSCWGSDGDRLRNWRSLTASRLRQLFEVEEHGPVRLDTIFEQATGVLLSTDRRSAAGECTSDFVIKVNYDIPVDDFVESNSRLLLNFRTRQLVNEPLTSASGEMTIPITIDDAIPYKNRIPFRVSISIADNIRAEDRVFLHCCGPKRPAFVVTTPKFWVNDAELATEDDLAPERKYPVDGPIRIHLFANDATKLSVTSDENRIEQLISANEIWQTADSLDVFGEPAGQATYQCQLGMHCVSLTFQAKDVERGEFTLEDELRQTQVLGKTDSVAEILELYLGRNTDAYSRLGGLNQETRKRTRLARCFEDRGGWKPVLLDLLEPSDNPEKACGDFAKGVGSLNADLIEAVQLPSEALELLRQYSERRDSFREVVLSTAHVSGGMTEFPEYATYPFYLSEESSQHELLERTIWDYLLAHGQILEYLNKNFRQLKWEQAFVLVYLDCIVHWREDTSKNSCFLMGPWHPFVSTKRFMIQRALVMRAKRMIDNQDKSYRQLVGLLAQTAGFSWYPCLKEVDIGFDPAYVTPTSDPGWHLGFKQKVAEGNLAGQGNMLDSVLRSIRSNFGLKAKIDLPASGAMLDTVLGSYMRTFPGKRHIGVYFPSGFDGDDEVSTSDSFLHSENGPTLAGMHYPGGISLLFGHRPSFSSETNWTSPPLRVFTYEDRAECISEQHPDIQFCRSANKHTFLESSDVGQLPRGDAYQAVFSQSVSRITQGQSFIPQSAAEEWDLPSDRGTSLGASFIRNSALACQLCGNRTSIVHATSLPLRQETSWTVVPGAVLDPAVFVEYVKSGRERHLEDRALWDYRVSLANASTSFFVLSNIPSAFRNAVNGVFGTAGDLASEFVSEMGQIGLAIAGEAMKSGRHALGCIGLVGAVRLFMGHANAIGPLTWSSESIGFLLPVDAFRDILEVDVSVSARRHESDYANRRADLLAVVIGLPSSAQQKLVIQGVAIECKFTSGTFPNAHVHDALDQARVTTKQFERLCGIAMNETGMPERLALLQLIRFGLRIASAGQQTTYADHLALERIVYESILEGRFEYRVTNSPAILVSTEMTFLGAAESNQFGSGIWTRLNQTNWPGIAETSSIAALRAIIARVFNIRSTSPLTGGESPAAAPIASAGGQASEQFAPSPHAITDEPPSQDLPDDRSGSDAQGDVPATVTDFEETSTDQAASTRGIALKPILLGVDTSRRSVYFDPYSPVDRLDNANVMVTGSPGKGKTQLLKYLITKIRNLNANCFLLDFKNDFANDSHFITRAGISAILVTFDGMPFNPLIPYPIRDPRSGGLFVQCAQHITGVAAVLRRTYSLGSQQEAAVKNAIRQAFAEAGVDPTGTVEYNPSTRFPDFSRVGRILEQSNAAAYNRLDPLFTLGIFKEEFSNASFERMVNLSAAVDFSQIPSDALKNALAELIILSAHSYYNSQSHCGALRQVFVVDEAHRILGADYLGRFALECRAYGVSLMLSSQYPSQFPPEISSSLATKIIHGNDRDVSRVRYIVNLLGCPGRESEIADLGMFEAIFSNKHFRNVTLRTITYPLDLVLEALKDRGEMTRDEIANIDGLDVNKLSVGNIVRYLERLGFCESIDDRVKLLVMER